MQDRVGRVQHAAEQFQLLAQNLECQAVGLVVARDEINHGDVALLAVPVAAADALLDALGVPGQIVIDDGLAKLQVQALRARFGADQNFGTRSELMHQRQPHGHLAAWLGSRWKTRALFLLPARQRLSRAIGIVHAAEQGNVFVAQTEAQQ